MEKKVYKAGELIYRENTDGSTMFVIQSGKVRVFKTLNGEKIILSTIEKGSFFGEMSLFLGQKRQASIEAIEPTGVLEYDHSSFTATVKNDPVMAMNIIKTISLRLSEAHTHIARMEGQIKLYEMKYGKN